MDRTGQVWRSGRGDVFVVLGPKTLSTQFSADVWWSVFYMDGDHQGAEDAIFESSDRQWERRAGLRRVT
jgi:hypothetical protein